MTPTISRTGTALAGLAESRTVTLPAHRPVSIQPAMRPVDLHPGGARALKPTPSARGVEPDGEVAATEAAR